MEGHRILIVDDDPKLLKSFQRVLGRRFDTMTVNSGEAGVEALDEYGPFTVIISDYKMPGMNGLDFLQKAGEVAPQTVRILLTGFADLEMSLRALNEADVFRLLTKPCPPKTLAKALMDAVRYHEAMAAERQMMDQTLKTSVGLLSDMVSLLMPDVYGRGTRILPLVRRLAKRLGEAGDWEIETGALLSMIGFITLPDAIIKKALKGKPLSPLEEAQFEDHPGFSAKFIAKVPRMEDVSRIVEYHEKHYNGSGVPDDGISGDDIPLGARILKAVNDYDALLSAGKAKGDALTVLFKREGVYDPKVLDALADIIGDEARYCLRQYFLHGLEPGMILAEDLMAMRGNKRTKVLAKGQELSEMVIEYLHRYTKRNEIEEPISVIEHLTCTL